MPGISTVRRRDLLESQRSHCLIYWRHVQQRSHDLFWLQRGELHRNLKRFLP
jgi:hypothetical protein